MAGRRTPTVFVVSDGRGETATMVVRAAAVQFEDRGYRAVLRPGVRLPDEVVEIVREAKRSRAVIFYTLVAAETRRAMRRASGQALVPTVDLLGPAFSALGDLFGSKRGATPGLLHDRDRERVDRMDAIDYTLKHDDGRRPHELSKADVVLVGVSRASKSSTCFFLAYEGVRAANVPLVPGVAPPPQLLKLRPSRVVGLRINVERLLAIRQARVRGIGEAGTQAYVDRRSVAREVIAANRLMDERGWSSIDVSYLAIEEIAREVLRLTRLRRSRPW